MDSISSVSLEKANKLGIERQQFPSEKDCTDTELAKKGADEAIILGALGDRPDHSLANIFLMVGFKKLGLEVKLADGNWEMFLIDGPVEIHGKKGDILSLIPISSEACGVETQSLYYPLKGETLFMGPARGISNIFLEDTVRIGIKHGLLLAVRYSGD
jgi:thiamine pyrophosphokinase